MRAHAVLHYEHNVLPLGKDTKSTKSEIIGERMMVPD